MPNRIRVAFTVAVVAILVGSLLAVVAGGATAVLPSPSRAGAAALLTTARTTSPSAPHAPAASTPSTSARASSALARGEAIINELRADGVPAQDIHLPNLLAEGPHPTKQVSMPLTGAPAPMGLSDIGLRNVSGNLVPYILNTTSAKGTISFTNAQSMYVPGDGADMFGVQMNSVLTNVTVFGNSSYQFWTQSYVSYTSSSGELIFGDEVWNWSDLSGYFPASTLYAHDPSGSILSSLVYQGYGPTFTVRYPFSVTFYLNSTTLFDRPAMFFNYTVASTTVHQSGSFDYLVFNSSVTAPTHPAPTPQFQVNGETWDPIGEINDIELVVCGNDDGDTTTFYQMNATVSIDYWNSTEAAYAPIPSAYDVGVETGETADGVEVYYNAPGGVVQPVAHLITGPSFVSGLWNVSSAAGVRLFQLTQDPPNAFLFVTPGTSFNQTTAQWVPTIPFGGTTSNFGIPNDGNPYYFSWLFSDYHPSGAVFDTAANSTDTFTKTLVRGGGLTTPLLAWGNGELASISRSGAGTAASPYMLESNQRGSLDPVFSQWNDWLWPVFPGLLLVNTTDWVNVTPPTFEINYPAGQTELAAEPPSNVPGLPNSNDLQIEFAYVSNVTLTDAPSISGWLSSTVSFQDAYPFGAVIFWNSSGNLVAGNTFYDQGFSLALFGGTNNTIWGNTFLSTAVATSDPSSIANQDPLNVTGIYESDSGDRIYNNYFDVAVPAFTPTFNPLLTQNRYEPASYTDSWNVSLEPASATATFLDATLSGSIIDTWYQGGNYWSNYGTQSNPFGILPYNDSGAITNGGDYVPLIPFSLYSVTFTETGLAPGTAWNVSALGVTTSSGSASLVLWSPNGTYNYTLPSPMGYQSSGSANFTVNGAAASVAVSFAPVEAVTFSETGLIAGVPWSVEVKASGSFPSTGGNSSGTTLVLDLVGGTPAVAYSGNASAFGYAPVDWTTHVGTSSATVSLSFTPAVALEFSATGLPSGVAWTVQLEQGTWTTTASSVTATLQFPESTTPAGRLGYTVSAVGYVAKPATGSVVGPSANVIAVAFTPINGTFAARVAPVTATLTVGGQTVLLAANGSASISLTPGLYAVEVTATGYLPYFDNVSVASAHTSSLAVSLTSIPAAPAPAVSSAAWAAIGLLAALVVVLLVIMLGYRSRARRPPPKAVPPASPPTASAPASGPEAVPPADWSEK